MARSTHSSHLQHPTRWVQTEWFIAWYPANLGALCLSSFPHSIVMSATWHEPMSKRSPLVVLKPRRRRDSSCQEATLHGRRPWSILRRAGLTWSRGYPRSPAAHPGFPESYLRSMWLERGTSYTWRSMLDGRALLMTPSLHFFLQKRNGYGASSGLIVFVQWRNLKSSILILIGSWEKTPVQWRHQGRALSYERRPEGQLSG